VAPVIDYRRHGIYLIVSPQISIKIMLRVRVIRTTELYY
jgi:hypothetical protein